MKCSFCLTGDLGLKGHLRASEIAGQIQQVEQTLPEGKRITNIVMMGMGEPLHNYDNLVVALRTMLHDFALRLSHRKITISSVGLLPALERITEEMPINLAISLNASTEEQRREVMPITKVQPASTTRYLLSTITISKSKGRRITFEYVMMKGFNDSLDDADRLTHLLKISQAKSI